VSDPKTCSAVVDYDEERECDLTCGEPAEFECCGEYLCRQCAHDWLDEIEPGFVHEVSFLATEPA
jgi:hypothetical protein